MEVEELETYLICPTDVESIIDALGGKARDHEGRRRFVAQTHFDLLRKILQVLCWYFEHQRRVQFEGCVAEPLEAITAILPRENGAAFCFLQCCKTR